MNNSHIKAVDEGIPWGIYKAYSNGKPIMNEDGDFLNIASMKGDRTKIRELIQAAESFGLDGITVQFLPGARQVDDETYEEQLYRLANGMVPDEHDLGNMIDEYKYRKQHGF